LTGSSHFCHNYFDTLLIDNPHTLGGNPEFYESIFTLQPELMVMDIWHKSTASLIVGVGNVISRDRSFTCDLTYLGHIVVLLFLRIRFIARMHPSESRALYQNNFTNSNNIAAHQHKRQPLEAGTVGTIVHYVLQQTPFSKRQNILVPDNHMIQHAHIDQ